MSIYSIKCFVRLPVDNNFATHMDVLVPFFSIIGHYLEPQALDRSPCRSSCGHSNWLIAYLDDSVQYINYFFLYKYATFNQDSFAANFQIMLFIFFNSLSKIEDIIWLDDIFFQRIVLKLQ